MGADLIGYQTMLPAKLTKEELVKINKHLDDVEALLKDEKLPARVAKEEDAHGEYLSKLNNLIPTFPCDLDNDGIAEEEEEIKYLAETYLDLVGEGRKFLTDFPNIEGRDISIRGFRILGRLFVSIFAGDMSWGDEPEGYGYSTLKDLDKINLLGYIETLCIPDSQSTHFIKEEEDGKPD
jgi:hypothetical protein